MDIGNPQVLSEVAEYNETEVRFHIVDQIMRRLGYPGGEEVFFKPEEKLEYPYYFIGHKNRKKDLPLGFPDYRAGLKGRRGSFIVEAKAATSVLTQKDVEQAHSYAAHSQVGANYFVLSNGLQVAVYETLSGGSSDPIVLIDIGDLDRRFHELDNILAPRSLEANCRVSYDSGLRICGGLASSVRIHSGVYDMSAWAYRIFINDQDCTEILKSSVPQFSEMDDQMVMLQEQFELRVKDGLVERADAGRISANVKFSGVTKNSQEAMQILGVDQMGFATDAEYMSVHESSPTVFESTVDFSVDKGVMFPPTLGKALPLEQDVRGDVFVTARLFFDGEAILGQYAANAVYLIEVPILGRGRVELDFSGNVDLRLMA
ncbi:putative type IV restriction endonuclease [Marinibacterium anthonyi]|nr:putative type IV restriction endonuclease [Marinibacterium anthonyi]